MGQIMQAEFEAEQQTPVMSLQRSQGQFEVTPPLPVMDETRSVCYTSGCDGHQHA